MVNRQGTAPEREAITRDRVRTKARTVRAARVRGGGHKSTFAPPRYSVACRSSSSSDGPFRRALRVKPKMRPVGGSNRSSRPAQTKARRIPVKGMSLTNRTAVYGPVRTVVWEGSGLTAAPYPDSPAVRALSGRHNRLRVPGLPTRHLNVIDEIAGGPPQTRALPSRSAPPALSSVDATPDAARAATV